MQSIKIGQVGVYKTCCKFIVNQMVHGPGHSLCSTWALKITTNRMGMAKVKLNLERNLISDQ